MIDQNAPTDWDAALTWFNEWIVEHEPGSRPTDFPWPESMWAVLDEAAGREGGPTDKDFADLARAFDLWEAEANEEDAAIVE